MDPYFKLLLLLLLVNTTHAGKYIYGPTRLNWFEAREFCRTKHTDLAPMDSSYDISLIQKLDYQSLSYSWIGLRKTTDSSTGWMWSGGAEMGLDKQFWVPDKHLGKKDYAALGTPKSPFPYLWQDFLFGYNLGFLCYKVQAIRVKKTWYEALDYCRSRHQDLASVASVTEMMLMQREVSKKLSTHNVWIGLQFLDGGWVWMDGQPFTFEAWVANQKPVCPDLHLSCGALQVVGPVHGMGKLRNVTGVKGWTTLNCNFRQHFLCY